MGEGKLLVPEDGGAQGYLGSELDSLFLNTCSSYQQGHRLWKRVNFGSWAIRSKNRTNSFISSVAGSFIFKKSSLFHRIKHAVPFHV